MASKQDIAWAQRVKSVRGFAAPWSTKGVLVAHAYPVAASFAAAEKGFKGKRNPQMFLMTNTGSIGKLPCGRCGIALAEKSPDALSVDRHSRWTWYPGKGAAGGFHYTCSWSNTFDRIVALRHQTR